MISETLRVHDKFAFTIPIIEIHIPTILESQARKAAWKEILSQLHNQGINPRNALFRGTSLVRVEAILEGQSTDRLRPLDCYTFDEMEECIELGLRDAIEYAFDHLEPALIVLDADDMARREGHMFDHVGQFPFHDSIQAIFSLREDNNEWQVDSML